MGCAVRIKVVVTALLLCALPTPVVPGDEDGTANVAVDLKTRYQTVEGFGFFGGLDVDWGSSSGRDLWSSGWGDAVINDLGLTLWRTTIPPHIPPDANTNDVRPDKQDSWWAKQRIYTQGMWDAAARAGFKLRIVISIWSPPSEFKCAVDYDGSHGLTGERYPEEPHPDRTKKGGTLRPSDYAAYGRWLADGVDLYKKPGMEVYALSLQNEPAFYEDYNSCQYTPEWYVEMMKTVIPVVKKRHPSLLIFGAEHMLGTEARDRRRTGFHAAIRDDADALKLIDRWAFHGYTNGVNAEDIDTLGIVTKLY